MGRSLQRGIALMMVLWVLALLTIIAVGLTATQRTESTLAGNQLATVRFRAASEAGVSYAVLNLLAPPSPFDEEADVWVPDGAARSWTFAGETLEIRVFNEASRIDLNEAPKDLLAALALALDLPEDEAIALGDAIEDWRDTDDLTQLNGAEDGDYESEGRSYGAKDGPFDSVEELQLVLGVTPELYRALAPALTVDSGSADVDQEFAEPLVRAALQGITLEEAELAQQEQEALTESGFAAPGAANRGGPLYRLRITRMVEGAPGQSMEALINVERGGTPPYSLLWRRFGLTGLRPDPSDGDGAADAGDY
jgi:general secretion pathway protein K